MSQFGSSSETQIRGVDLRMNRLTLSLLLLVITMTLTSCSVIKTTFSVIKTTYKTIQRDGQRHGMGCSRNLSTY